MKPINIAPLVNHIEQGTLIRRRWNGTDSQGRHLACLLAALSPEAAESESPNDCPAHAMPGWLAHLTIFIDDRGTDEAWPATVRKYAELAARWHVLSDEAWHSVLYRLSAVILRQALEWAPEFSERSQPTLAQLDAGAASRASMEALYHSLTDHQSLYRLVKVRALVSNLCNVTDGLTTYSLSSAASICSELAVVEKDSNCLYREIDDLEAALEYGSPTQQQEAQRIIDATFRLIETAIEGA